MNRKKALIVYYSQSGQMKDILDSVCAPLQDTFELTVEQLRCKPEFPFPWKGISFFQSFPESVQEIPCELEEFSFDPEENYDLVILGYSPWYLSPSIPMTSFLQTEAAAKVLKGKPVITVLGCRNMWIQAQERMKVRIHALGGMLRGNIVLNDTHHNLVSVITIVYWMSSGKRHGGGLYGRLFPEAGVSRAGINKASVFGSCILRAFEENSLDRLQQSMLEEGAVNINPVLMTVEKRGKGFFGPWSRFVLKKGRAWDPRRNGRLKLFRFYLFAVIYLVSPIGGAVVWLIHKINYRKTRKAIAFYSGVDMK